MTSPVPGRETAVTAADAVAGVVAAVVTLLLGAPVGLLWAALAPRVEVVVAAGDVKLTEPGTSAFIAADGYFLALAVLVGAASGVLGWQLGRRHGPALVAGLVVGGLLAAYVAREVGEQVGLEAVQQAVLTGRQGALELSLVLRSDGALLAWPAAAMVGLLVPAFLGRGTPSSD